jgi:hypothetical protein
VVADSLSLVEQLFIEAAIHRSGFSSKRLFIKAVFIKSTYKWLIHQMNESVGSMNGQWLFIE